MRKVWIYLLIGLAGIGIGILGVLKYAKIFSISLAGISRNAGNGKSGRLRGLSREVGDDIDQLDDGIQSVNRRLDGLAGGTRTVEDGTSGVVRGTESVVRGTEYITRGTGSIESGRDSIGLAIEQLRGVIRGLQDRC